MYLNNYLLVTTSSMYAI